MKEALPSVLRPRKKFGLRAAIGGPIGLWLPDRKHWAQLSWVLVGKFALLLANAAVMLFLANRLELRTYGLLVVTISGQLLISRFLMMGVDAGMLRLTAIPELRARSREIVTAGLILIVCSSSVLLAAFLLVAPALSWSAVPVWVVACIVTGAVGTSLVDYGYSFRLARQEYSYATLAQGGTATLRLGVTTLAALVLPAYTLAVFIAYHGASLLSGLAQSLVIGRTTQRPDRALIRRLLRYSLWQGKSNVIVIFSLYLGTFLLMALKQPEATAIFGLGLTLSLGFFAIFTAYSEYLLVQVRQVEHVKTLPEFVRRAFTGALILIIACVPVVFLVAKFVPWFLGREWLEVVPIFAYLAASMLLLILQAPLEAVCHYFLRPQAVTISWIVRAVLIGVAGLILAPRMGATGAAIAQLIGSGLGLLVLSFFVARLLRSGIEVDG